MESDWDTSTEVEIVIDPTSGLEYPRLPRTVGVMEVGGNWPGAPTLWQRFLRLVRRRRS
jgi:hypothetical protein